MPGLQATQCKSRSKKHSLRHVTYFYNFGTPLYISGMGEATDFKFGVQIDCQACKPKKAKVGQKGMAYVKWPTIIIFWDFLDIFGMGKVRDFKFGISKTVTDTMLGSIKVE